MATTNYKKGLQFEYRVRDFFKSMNYNVIRSAASKSDIDMIAVNENNKTWIIQCKKSKSFVTNRLIKQIFNIDKFPIQINVQENDDIINTLICCDDKSFKNNENILNMPPQAIINVKNNTLTKQIEYYMNSNNLFVIGFGKSKKRMLFFTKK